MKIIISTDDGEVLDIVQPWDIGDLAFNIPRVGLLDRILESQKLEQRKVTK